MPASGPQDAARGVAGDRHSARPRPGPRRGAEPPPRRPLLGLEDYGFYSYYVLGRRATVAVHPKVSARLWDGLLVAGMGETQVQGAAAPVQKHLDDFFDI